MKLVLSLLVLFFSLGASASTVSSEKVATTKICSVVKFDVGDKRRQKRINKKRKRKCGQFGRRIYAG